MTKELDTQSKELHDLESEIMKLLVKFDELSPEPLLKPGERIVIEGDRVKLVSSH